MSAEAHLSAKAGRDGIGLAWRQPKPKASTRPWCSTATWRYTSGHLPVTSDGEILKGKLGDDYDVDAGYKAAQLTAIGLLATMKASLGSLDRIRRVVKLFGMVNCTPDFDQQPAVINGASQLLADVFGPEHGIGARSAMGAGSLPLGVPVEIEAVFEIDQ